MTKCNRETLKSKRENVLYCNGFIWDGNGKLLDYTDDDGVNYHYAQYNTRPVIDCPFRSAGCEKVCYATKGNHVFPSVKESRGKSYMETKRADFGYAVAYTIKTEKESKRYKNAVMIVRIHESGDFYSLQYLKKWVMAWKELETLDGVLFVFYTKSFPFFLMLDDVEIDLINRMIDGGKMAINLSVDDTTTDEQWRALFELKKRIPKANIYRCAENVENVEHDNVCDCANCAKCGTCNHGTGKTTVVKIHSASENDMKAYRANIK